MIDPRESLVAQPIALLIYYVDDFSLSANVAYISHLKLQLVK